MNELNAYNDNQLLELLLEKFPISNYAFNIIYDRYAVKLKSYCLFKSGNSEDAEEIFQETWIKFHSSVLSGKKDIILPSYIYTIAHNLCIDKFRVKKNKNIYFNNDFNYDIVADPLNLQLDVENRELMNMIYLGLNQLSETNREAFILKWFSGLTFQEISKVLGESVDCVKQRSCRAFSELQKILKPIIADIKK